MVTRALSSRLVLRVMSVAPAAGQFSSLLEALQQRGYQLVCQSCVAADRLLIETAAPDLLLVDLRSLGSEAFEFCRWVRRTAELQDAVIIVVGEAIPLQSVLALRSGANDYFSWPLQLEASLLRLEQQLHMSWCIRGLRSDNASLSDQLRHQTQRLRMQTSLQLSLTQKNRQLQQLAFSDGLTHVANRRGFTQRLTQLWSVLARTCQPLGLILADVDHFKGYNDSYGHPAGDRCLQMIASVLQTVARRSTDVVARYGGEEFVILLPATPLEGVQQVAEQIQTALAQRAWIHPSNAASPYVTLSMGFSSLCPRETLSSDILVRMADEALYTAKQQGRNRFVPASVNDLSAFCGGEADPVLASEAATVVSILRPAESATANQLG